jgi:hypothetical protein
MPKTIAYMLQQKRQQDFDALFPVIKDEIRLLVSWWNRYNWEGKENWIERISYATQSSDTPLSHGMVIHFVQAALRGDLQLPQPLRDAPVSSHE